MANRFKIIFYLIIASGFLCVALPWMIWEMSRSHPLNVAIIDKTVPDMSYSQHKGLMWVLNQQKYRKGNAPGPYQYREDYYGFHPKPNQHYEIRDIPDHLEQADLLYITDPSGVHKDDLYGNSQTGDSTLLYGGLTAENVDKIKQAAFNGRTLISELNIFGAPTEPQERNELQSMMGITWSGWLVGKVLS